MALPVVVYASVLYTFLVNQKLKRLGLVSIVIVFTLIHLLLPVLSVSAETITTPDATFEKEYKRWKAALLLSNCTDNDFDESDDEIGSLGGKDGYTWGAGDIGASKVFGKLANISLSSNELDCSSSTVKNALGKAAGFDDIRGIEDLWFPPTHADGSSRRVDDHTPLSVTLHDLIDKYGNDRAAVRRALFEFTLKDDKNRGPDKKVELSAGAVYWYWKNSVAKDCYGGFSDDYARFQAVDSTSFRQPNDVASKDSPGGEYKSVNENAGKYTFKYAVFDGNGIPDDFDDTENVEGLDSDIVDDHYTAGDTDVAGGGQPPDCVDIVNLFKGNRMDTGIEEYLLEYKRLLQECTDSGKSEEECKTGLKTNPDVDTTAPQESEGDQEIEFQCSVSFNPISWFVCPLVAGFAEAINQLDKQINEMLRIDTDTYFGDTDVGNTFKSVWASVRAISVSLLVVIGLIMVIGTAIGTGFFDAYTVKKVFPRLVMAIVLISISWPLIIFIIDASNFMGIAVRSLIQGPFASNFQNAVKLDGAQLSLGSLGIVGLGMAIGPVGLLTFVAGALMAVAIAFLTLILREILVILLAVLAPAAIAAYILPNTQKAGKLWWDFFSKALLAFPIISGFVAIGRVFAIVSQQDGGGGTVRGFIGFIAYFAPYFVLPKAFAMAGGALGNLSGIVNDRSKGAFDRLRKVRQNKAKDNLERVKAGNYLRSGKADGTKWQRRFQKFNTALQTGSLIPKAGFNPGDIRGTRWRENVTGARALANTAHALHLLEQDQNIKLLTANDDVIDAYVAGQGNESSIRTTLQDKGYSNESISEIMGQLRVAQRTHGDHALQMIMPVANAGTGTGYKDGVYDMKAALARGAHGSMTTYSAMLAAARQRAIAGRRGDLAHGGFGTNMRFGARIVEAGAAGQEYIDMNDPELSLSTEEREAWMNSFTEEERTQGIEIRDPQGGTNPDGSARTVRLAPGVVPIKEYINRSITDNALFVNGAGAVISMRGDSFKNMVPAINRRIDRAKDAVDKALAADAAGSTPETQQARAAAEQRWVQVLAETKAFHDVASQVAPENAELLSAEVLSRPAKVPYTDGSIRDGKLVDLFDAYTNDEAWNQMRMDYRRSIQGSYMTAEQASQQAQLLQAQGLTGGLPPVPGVGIPPAVPPAG